MSLFKKYQKQIALALITSGVISSYPINVQATTDTVGDVTPKTVLGLPVDPTVEIGAPRSTEDKILDEAAAGDSATGNTAVTGSYEVLGTTVAKAINYAQAMNISRIDGIEFNGDETQTNIIVDPSDPDKNAPAQQKFLDTSVSASNQAHAALMTFFKPAVQSISSSLNADDLKEIRTKLNNLVTNIEALTVADATGHSYYAALTELLQYIDTIDAHMDMAPDLPTSLIVESDSKSTDAPAKLDPDFSLPVGVVTNTAPGLETRPIHVSQFKGADVPTNEHWISDSIYDDLKEAIDEATTIAQNVHPSALFATEALANTKTIGAIVNLNLKDATNSVDGIVLNPAHSRNPYANTQTVATPGDKSFGTPQGTDDNYSELDDLTDALTNLKDAYTAYVRDTATQKGTAEIAKNVLNAQAKLKATMAMSGMKDVADNSTKTITDLIGSLKTLVDDAPNESDTIGTPDTNNSSPNTELSQDNKIYVYVRKATSADITNTADVQDFRYLSSGTAIDAAAVTAGTLIVCTPDEAEDIALYQAPTATGHDLTAHCAPLVTYGDDKYFIAPMIKESSDHVPTWFLGGEHQVAGTPTTEKTAGTYITTAEATEQLKAINTAITTYKLYDNVQDNGSPYTELEDLMIEIEAADDNLSDFIEDTLNERIETILDDIHKTGTGQLKDSAYLTLQKLMFHLGMATDASGTFTLDTDLDESFGLPYQGTADDDGSLDELRATPTASFELEKNAKGNDWADFMTNGNGTGNAPVARKFHNVSDVYGINLAKADTWVTQEEHNTLYTEAKEAYEFIKTIDDHTDGQPELVEYKKTTTSAIQEHIDDLIEAIENYDDAAEDGNLEALKKDYDKLKAQVGQKETTPSGGLKYLELPTLDENGKITDARTLVSANKIAISDEGIFKITTESMTADDNPSGSAVIEQKQLFVANDHTHWVTPAEVTALQSPLQIASDLKTLLDLVSGFEDTPVAKDFSDSSSVTADQRTALEALGKVFYEETENDAAYSISPITDNLKDAISTFETAAEKEALEPSKYTTPRSGLRTLLWGGTDSATPANDSIRTIVSTKIIQGTPNTVHIYLEEDTTIKGSAGTRTLVVSKDNGVTFEIFDAANNKWTNGGLLVDGTVFGNHTIDENTKWISLDALTTYGNAILAAEKTLADSVPTAKVIASPGASATEPSEDAVKIPEANLVTANTTTYTAISELSTETLNAIKAGTYFSSAKTTLEGAKTTFTNAQTTISADSAVAKAQKALADFKTKLGTANAGADGSDSKANGYIVGNATVGSGDKKIVAAIKNNAGNVTGYFPINVHQSEDGIARADNKGILDITVDSSVGSEKITKFVNNETITALSDAFLAVDSLITKVETDLASDTDRSAMIENLNVGAKETPYLETTTEYTTLKGLIESYSPTESKAGAYKTAVENIAPPTDKAGLLTLLKKDVIPGSGITAVTDIPLKFVTESDITTLAFDDSIAQYSLDGLYKANADGTAVDPQENLAETPAKWVNPTSTTNLINALKAMNTLVTEANALTSDAANNNKAMKDHIAAFILDNDYFTKTSEYTDRTNALNAFKVGTVEVIDQDDLEDLVTKAKGILYGTDGTVGGEDTAKDLLISAIEGKDLLTLAELEGADTDKNGLDQTEIDTLGGQLKYVTADYAKTLTDALQDNDDLETGASNEDKTKIAKALAVAINKYEAELKTMDIASDNHEIALYNSYVSIKPVLYYTDSKNAEQKVMSDNKNGANTEIGKKWLTPKEYEKADETYTDIESLLANTSHTNVARFINDASDLIEDAQIVATYEPKEGTLDPTLAAQINTALGNLANAINSLASTIGANEYIVEENKELTENKNTVKDTENMIYPSFLLGTDIEGSDSADDNDLLPDTGKKWLPPAKINEARSSISTALNTYKNRQSLVIINNKTTELTTLVSTLQSSAQFGSKGIYDEVAKHIEKYLILMVDGLAKKPNANVDGVDKTYSEIIPLGKISREENGEEVWPINYWASPEEYMAIMAVYMECDNILANKANLVDRKITLPLADLINYYSKIKTAFENFYAVDITGANIEGKTSKVQTGTKGILDGVLTAEITKAEAQVNGLCFILGTEIEGYTGIKSENVNDSAIHFYVSANGLDVPADYRWYDLADVQTYVDAIKLAKETKPATSEILNSLKDAIANFETKLQPVSSGNTDPAAQEFLAAQTKTKAALKIAYNLIGFTFDEDSYTTSADVIDGTEATFDANLQAPTGMTFTLIKESESGNGTDISEDNYWVTTKKFEEYKERLEGFVNIAKTADNKESLNGMITGLTSTVHSLMNTAYRMGVGSLENMAIAENDLRKLVTKCLFLRDGKKHEDNDTYNPIFDGSSEDSLYTTYWPNLHADGYILSASMNGRDISKEGYWAMTMLYYNFSANLNAAMNLVNRITAKEGVTISNVEQIIANLNKVLNYVAPNGKPRIGSSTITSGTDDNKVDKAKEKAELRVIVDQTKLLISKVIETDPSKGAISVDNGVQWITNKAIGKVGPKSDAVASENFKDKAPIAKLKELIDAANVKLRKPVKADSDFSHSDLDKAVDEFEAIISGNEYKYTPEGGSEQTVAYNTYKYGGTGIKTPALGQAVEILETRVAAIESFMKTVKKITLTTAEEQITDNAEYLALAEGDYYISIPFEKTEDEVTLWKTLKDQITAVGTAIKNVTSSEDTVIESTLTGKSTDGETMPKTGLRTDVLSELNAAFEKVAGKLDIEISFAFGGKNQTFKYSGEMGDGVNNDGSVGNSDVSADASAPLRQKVTETGTVQPGVNLGEMATKIKNLFMASNRIVVPYESVTGTAPNQAGVDMTEGMINDGTLRTYIADLIADCIKNDVVKIEVTTAFPMADTEVDGKPVVKDSVDIGTVSSVTGEAGKNTVYNGSNFKIKLTEMKDSNKSDPANPANSYDFNFGKENSKVDHVIVDGTTSLHVEVAAPKFNYWNDLEKMDVLRAATILYSNRGKLSVHAETGLDEAGIKTKLAAQITAMLTEAGFSNISAEIKPEIVESPKDSEDQKSLAGGELLDELGENPKAPAENKFAAGKQFKFTVSLIDTPKPTFTPEVDLLPQPAAQQELGARVSTTIEYKLYEEFGTADTYKVTFIDSGAQSKAKPEKHDAFTITIAANNSPDVSSVTTLMDKINAGAFSTIQGNTIADKHVADTAIMATVNELLKDLDLTGVSIEIIESGDGYPAGTGDYAFQIKITKGKVTQLSAEREITNIPEPATKAMATFYEPIEDEYLHYMDTDGQVEVEPDFDYYYEAEFVEEFVAEEFEVESFEEIFEEDLSDDFLWPFESEELEVDFEVEEELLLF